MRAKSIIFLGAVFLALAVILGAFGAHGLEGKISTAQLGTYQTANTYHFYHGFGLIIAGLLKHIFRIRILGAVSLLFIAGIVLFSGSLYLLSVDTLLGIEKWRWLGPVTPVGGLCFILAWGLLGYGFLKKENQ